LREDFEGIAGWSPAAAIQPPSQIPPSILSKFPANTVWFDQTNNNTVDGAVCFKDPKKNANFFGVVQGNNVFIFNSFGVQMDKGSFTQSFSGPSAVRWESAERTS
jgi:hypothetical protein